ncbi:coatomer beta, partial [Hortaea werneckii]
FKPKAGDGSVNVGFTAEGLSGGALLGVKGQGGIGFFDWESGQLVRRIEVEPRNVYWSESGELVCLACEDTFYVLRYSREQYVAALQAGTVEEDGVEEAFEVVCDINESVRTGQWIGDCFVYTNAPNRLNYLVGDQTYTISHFDQPYYVLGYLTRDQRIYVCDKDLTVTSFALSVSVIEYQTLVLRGDMDAAQGMLDDIPPEQKGKIARFLEGQGYKDLALQVATDPEHRFELALGLGELQIALALARDADVEHKWKIVGDAALAAWDLALAEECFTHSHDLGSLLLLYSSASDATGLRSLADQAKVAGQWNVAFTCLWLVRDIPGCLDVLVRTNRTAEAVLFAQTYAPSRCQGLVEVWKAGLEKEGKGKVARSLGTPGVDGEMFPEWEEYLRLEKEVEGRKDGGGGGGDGAADLIDVGTMEDGKGEDGVLDGEVKKGDQAAEGVSAKDGVKADKGEDGAEEDGEDGDAEAEAEAAPQAKTEV